MDIDKLVDKFVFQLRMRGFSENTISSYMSDLKDFVSFFEDKNVSKTSLYEFMEKKLVDKYKVSTVNRKLSSIRSFLKFLVKHGYLDIDYSILKNVKTRRKPPDYVPFDVIGAALDNSRDGLIVRLMYAAGLRVSEVANLRISDVMFDSGFLRIKGKGDKERFVPVDFKTLEMIRKYIEKERKSIKGFGADDHLFLSNRGKPFSRQALWKIVKKRFKKLGYDIHPHTLRHMFATHMIENGANIRAVQELLGHENITTTQIYTDISDRAVEDAYHSLEVKK